MLNESQQFSLSARKNKGQYAKSIYNSPHNGDKNSITINPFQQIERSLIEQEKEKKQLQVSNYQNYLDFSIIQFKSPTYSEFFSSLSNQKQRFFNKQPRKKMNDAQKNLCYGEEEKIINHNINHKQQKKIDYKHKIQYQALTESIKTKREIKTAENQSLQNIPTLFIKVPDFLRGQKMKQKIYRKQQNAQIEKQLQEIYAGKYKITLNL